MKILTKRREMAVIFVLLGLFAFWPHTADALDKVKFGQAVRQDFAGFAGVVGKDRGFFGTNGIDLQLYNFKGGGDLITAAGAGKIQFGGVNAASIAMAVMRGAPIKMVSGRLIAGKGMTMIAKKETKTLKDLKGKAVGITRFGSMTDFLVRKTAENFGWDPEKDITILPLGGLSAQEAAFLTNKTDGFIWTIAVARKFQKKYGTNSLSFDVPMPSGIFTQNDLIKENPDLVRRLLQAWYRATRYMNDNPEYTIKLVMKEYEMDEEEARLAYTVGMSDMSLDGTVTRKGLENARESLKLLAKVKDEDLPSIEDFFTPQFLPAK